MSNDIEWKMVKLGEVATIIRGGSPRPIEDYITDSSDGINWIKIGDVAVGAKYIEHTEEKIISEGLYKSRSVKAGDFLLSNSMSFGRPYILKIDGAIHDGWLAIQDYNDTFEIEYLYYVLLTDFVMEQYKSMAAGSSVLNLNKQIVGKVKIPIPYKNGAPDLETQKQIAQKLGDMDSLIAAKEKLLAKKRNLKVAAMQKLIKDEEGENWKKVKLGEVATIVRGGSPRPIENFITNSSDGINWIKIGDVAVGAKYIEQTEEKIIPEGMCKSRAVRAGDFLLSNSMSFGRPYILKIDGAIHDGWLAIQNYSKTFDTDYLYYVLSSDVVLNQYLSMAAGSSVLNLNKQIVSKVVIPAPVKSSEEFDLTEQRRIASILSDMDCEIAAIEKEITKLQDLKTAMMQKMFCFGDSDSSSE